MGECFTVAIISGIEKVWIRGRGVSRFSTEIFLFQSAEKFCRGNLSALCFQKFPVAKKFMEKRGGVGQDFPPENFCLTMPKNFVWELLCAVFQNFPGSGKDFE